MINPLNQPKPHITPPLPAVQFGAAPVGVATDEHPVDAHRCKQPMPHQTLAFLASPMLATPVLAGPMLANTGEIPR